jgi:hypothetical protein
MAMPKGKRVKQFCPKGHDTFVVGRDRQSHCNACDCAWQTAYAICHSKKILSYQNQYRKLHPEIHNAAVLKCSTNRNLRIVSWTDWESIKKFYKNMPKGMVGDHIIPLQGKKVSGLHVSWNLQYLVSNENYVKHNKCDLVKMSEWYGKILEQAGLK